MKRGRLRSVGRWGVFAVTALVLISIPVSVWVEPGMSIVGRQYQKPNTKQVLDTLYFVDVVELRFRILHDPSHVPNLLGGALPKDEWRFYFWQNSGQAINRLGWLSRPVMRSFNSPGGGILREIDCPLVYPAGLMMGWSVWLIWAPSRRRMKGLGRCAGCGYSLAGLDGGVCPECGGGEIQE